MNDEQYKRYRKMLQDPIKDLFTLKDKQGNLHFLISGSSGTKYKVTIFLNGKIACSCPDFKHHGNSSICKHCLYVLFKSLHGIFSIKHAIFTRKPIFFTPDEIMDIKNSFKNF